MISKSLQEPMKDQPTLIQMTNFANNLEFHLSNSLETKTQVQNGEEIPNLFTSSQNNNGK